MYTIPFSSFAFQHNMVAAEIQEAIATVSGRNWFILGKEVEEFEYDFAEYTGTAYCVGVGNGLDALTIALQAVGIGKGDEVIVPAHTYVATWLAVTRTDARIVPVEPDQATFNLDGTRIEGALSSRTRAIVPVHMYGQSCDMTQLDLLARKHGLAIIEDNAQGHGAMWLQRKTGSFGAVNATSFYPTKNLGAWGDGGALTMHSAEYQQFAKAQRNYGSLEKNVTARKGVNSRLDEIQAAILKVKLRKLDEWNLLRRELATRYLNNLTNVGDLILPRSTKEAYHVYHQFVVRTHSRDELKKFLAAKGIETLIHYPTPPFLQPAYHDHGFKKEEFPIATLIAASVLSLPLWPGMTADQVDYVSQQIVAFYR